MSFASRAGVESDTSALVIATLPFLLFTLWGIAGGFLMHLELLVMLLLVPFETCEVWVFEFIIRLHGSLACAASVLVADWHVRDRKTYLLLVLLVYRVESCVHA